MNNYQSQEEFEHYECGEEAIIRSISMEERDDQIREEEQKRLTQIKARKEKMTEVEQQIKKILDDYPEDNSRRLELQLETLVIEAKREQMKEDHNSTLEILRKK